VQLTTLRILRDKGIITQAEYDSAVRDMTDSLGQKGAGDANTVVVGKWATTLYGFVEADSIYDSTESFNDLAGNGQVSHVGSYSNDEPRVQFGIRNTRLGMRMKAPEVSGVRVSAQLEMDFLGNQMPVGPANAGSIGTGNPATSEQPGSTGSGTSTEAQYFTNPTMRIRHANLKVETPVVDLLFGQYWDLYGWQQVFAPNSVEIQGLPGQIYSRTPQVRISKTLKNEDVIFEAAIAAMRPPQRDSAVPEGQWGVRLGTPRWSGLTTGGATGTGVQPLSVAVTGDVRQFTLPAFSNPGGAPTVQGNSKVGDSIAVDAFIPVIPAKERQGNALSISGEFSTGYGNADLYTGLSGGAPGAAYTVKGVTYYADVDPGMVVYDNLGQLHLIQWQSFLVDLQYYLPGLDGRVWVSGNISNISSNNLKNFQATAAKARDHELWGDANLFWAPTDALRFGAEFALFDDVYADGTHAQNIRTQFSAFYVF
jgi:hypothetical protein